MRNISRYAVVAGAIALALVAGACSSDDERTSEGVARLDSTSAPDAAATERQDIEDAVLDFSQCMRDGGIDIPDIELDANGAPIIRTDDVAGIDLESPEFRNAFAGCSSILTSAGAFSFDSDPELLAIFQDQLQQFSECMRTEGVTDFPDPIAGTSGIPYPLDAFANFADESFQAALEVCQQQIGFSGLGG